MRYKKCNFLSNEQSLSLWTLTICAFACIEKERIFFCLLPLNWLTLEERKKKFVQVTRVSCMNETSLTVYSDGLVPWKGKSFLLILYPHTSSKLTDEKKRKTFFFDENLKCSEEEKFIVGNKNWPMSAFIYSFLCVFFFALDFGSKIQASFCLKIQNFLLCSIINFVYCSTI